MHSFSPIAVLGAGSWGTAMAMHIARSGQHVILWSNEPDQVDAMRHDRSNESYLPGIAFPKSLEVSSDLNQVLARTKIILIAVPSHAFASVLGQMSRPKHGLAWLTKGLDPSTHHLLSQVVQDLWGMEIPIAMISGPSFAKEVAMNLPTALVVASQHLEFAQQLKNVIHHDSVRVYLSQDLIGVQWAGALKNILAIACGISDGLCFGANAQAALITRGLTEMRRFGCRLAAHSETFRGLAGIGDLVLTCTDNQSRNRRFGVLVGQGMSVEAAEHSIGQVVEGKHNAVLVCDLAAKNHIDLPICQAVHAVLHGHLTAENAFLKLMQRPAHDDYTTKS